MFYVERTESDTDVLVNQEGRCLGTKERLYLYPISRTYFKSLIVSSSPTTKSFDPQTKEVRIEFGGFRFDITEIHFTFSHKEYTVHTYPGMLFCEHWVLICFR